jgi:hypothetical protein
MPAFSLKSFANSDFWEAFNGLPPAIQSLARKSFRVWITNPSHPSLHFKPVGQYWSVRVGIAYRALAVKRGDDFIWFWIGHHKDYERLIT